MYRGVASWNSEIEEEMNYGRDFSYARPLIFSQRQGDLVGFAALWKMFSLLILALLN